MLSNLSKELLQIRSHFLREIRNFFFEHGYIEVETPLLNPSGNFEPYLSPFEVHYPPAARGCLEGEMLNQGKGRRGYLIASPEYNLKSIIAKTEQNIFQIAHVFRAGDCSSQHSEEFLMLEFYRVGVDEHRLMDECEELLKRLSHLVFSSKRIRPNEQIPRFKLSELFELKTGAGFDRASIEAAVVAHGLLAADQVSHERYDDLFFLLFLNLVEPALTNMGPVFLHGYPGELAALSKVESGIARRFEIYWGGIELGNGYYELTDPIEHHQRFAEENRLRQLLGKSPMQIDPSFEAALVSGLPESSGIAIGLDRILMVLLGQSDLARLSPFI